MRVLLWVFLLLQGCGFHLRGVGNTPPWLNNVAVIIQQGDSSLGPRIRNQLNTYNVLVNPEPTSAKYWLFIDYENFRQNIMSVSSSTTARQYQLIYTVGFKLQEAKGAEIFPANEVIITRQLTINSDRILGSTEEEELLKSEMRRDAVIQILNRLSKINPGQLPKKRPL